MSSNPTAPAATEHSRVVSTGVPGLDEVLEGGLPPNRLYLIDGEPGAGKTTLALQFLLAGRRAGERGLFVTLSETADELRAAAESHGWSLEGIEIFELAAIPEQEAEDAYTLFHPAEIELQQTVGAVLDAVEQYRPTRVVFDSLSEMRLLARDPLRLRRQILALKQFFSGRACTVLVLDDRTGPEGDLQLQSIAHGVVALEQVAVDYGAERRRLQVKKLRGAHYRGGYHDFRIRTGGLEVYPRVRHEAGATREAEDQVSSGSAELDSLLGGGLTRGTSALITGAAGTGKSVLGMQFAHTAACRGERTRVYMFDERVATAMTRSKGLGIDLRAPVAQGLLSLCQIEPTQMSPGEFANEVVQAVEADGVMMIVIDSLNGLLQAMPNERLLGIQVHELLSYLASRGVTVLMTLVQRGIFGSPVDDTAEVSFLADTVLLLRYFEFAGAVRQAISVVKKRTGAHERTVREFRVQRGGMHLGDPLQEFRGVLTGVPEYVGGDAPLMHSEGASNASKRERDALARAGRVGSAEGR
ncbi:MAG TPA: ATPase domain-containing protein [Gemmatimonadaceae bacterium]|nr:ATPase domain-containing protein [Gemmatimonadaceae bacterium]